MTATVYHRVAEARDAGVKASSVLHWKEGMVTEFVCSSEQELNTDEDRQSHMLHAFVNSLSTANSASSIVAAHAILRQQLKTADHAVAEVGLLSSTMPMSSSVLKHLPFLLPSSFIS